MGSRLPSAIADRTRTLAVELNALLCVVVGGRDVVIRDDQTKNRNAQTVNHRHQRLIRVLVHAAVLESKAGRLQGSVLLGEHEREPDGCNTTDDH